MPAKISIIGKRFGRLIAIADAAKQKTLCRCDCGEMRTVDNYKLRTGHTQSCGCLNAQRIAAISIKHGMTRTKVYEIWKAMTQRTSNLKHKDWKYYGGRGIRVCDRWHSFEAFLADMGQPAPGLTLGRLNNDGNYEPGNCEWQTRKKQMRNTSGNTILTVCGVTGCLSELAEHFHIRPNIVINRIYRYKWSLEDAFLTPPIIRKRN